VNAAGNDKTGRDEEDGLTYRHVKKSEGTKQQGQKKRRDIAFPLHALPAPARACA